MIASLMMYARPELEGAHNRYWALIRAALADRGIDSPAYLSNDAPEFEVWRAPDLVLSQTCGMPYRLFLHDQVSLIGTPDYNVEGCPAGYYNSVIVVRADDDRKDVRDFQNARFIYNQDTSQSGFGAPCALASSLGFWFRDRSQSGGHRASARAVAGGSADIAALDAVTWQLIRRYDAFAARLRVLSVTSPTPGLPYISAASAPVAEIRNAVSEAIAALTPQDRADLCLQSLVNIPKDAYLAVPNPPADAA